jgi:hypothetical protein
MSRRPNRFGLWGPWSGSRRCRIKSGGTSASPSWTCPKRLSGACAELFRAGGEAGPDRGDADAFHRGVSAHDRFRIHRHRSVCRRCRRPHVHGLWRGSCAVPLSLPSAGWLGYRRTERWSCMFNRRLCCSVKHRRRQEMPALGEQRCVTARLAKRRRAHGRGFHRGGPHGRRYPRDGFAVRPSCEGAPPGPETT